MSSGLFLTGHVCSQRAASETIVSDPRLFPSLWNPAVVCVWLNCFSGSTGRSRLGAFPTHPSKTQTSCALIGPRAARVCVGGLGLGVLKQEMKGLCNESSRSVGVLGYSSVIRTSDGKCTQNKTCRLSGIMRNVSVDVFVNVSCVRSCESHSLNGRLKCVCWLELENVKVIL